MEQTTKLTINNTSYKELNDYFEKKGGGFIDDKDGKYSAFINLDKKAFIMIALDEYEEKPEFKEGKIFAEYGLKFHISLPEDIENLDKGWDIVKTILMDNNITAFKVIRQGRKMSEDPDQRGKTITVYADKNPEKCLDEWGKILERITKELTKANVPPGYRPPGTTEKPEKPIPGSNYITYRYHDEKEDKSIWPKEDPCEQGCEGRLPLIINVPNQLPIPTWKNDIIEESATFISNRK